MTEVQYKEAEILALLPHTYEDEELSLNTEELQFEELNERSQHQQGGKLKLITSKAFLISKSPLDL